MKQTVMKRLGNLLSVKSLVALALTAVFAYMSVARTITQEFMTVYAVVIAFYFGTQDGPGTGRRGAMKPVEKLLDIARGELGTAESPANSNRVKYNTWYYGREVSGAAYPWCMVFVQWCFDQAGVPLPVKTASCGAMRSAAQKAGQWVTGDYRPGDVVIYDFPGGAATDHTGIVEKVTASGVAAIEGNTSQSGSQSNGGQVCRKTRPAGQIVGAVRPRFEEEETDMDNVPSPAHQEGVEWAKEMGILTGDGSGDLKLTEPVTRQQMCTMLYRFAKKKGLSPEAGKTPGEAPGTQSVEKR